MEEVEFKMPLVALTPEEKIRQAVKVVYLGTGVVVGAVVGAVVCRKHPIAGLIVGAAVGEAGGWVAHGLKTGRWFV